MPYTPEQRSQIVEEFWSSGGSVRCPADDALIDVTRSTHFQGYFLIGRCPRCGQAVKASSEDDPKKAEFRRWSNEELAVMADEYFDSRNAACPVCELGVDCKPIQSPLMSTKVMFNCKRCRNHQTYSPPQPEQSAPEENS